MATKLALVTFLNLILIFLRLSTLCLGAPQMSSFANSKSPTDNAMGKLLKKYVKKQLDKYSQTNDADKVPQSDGIYEITFAIGTPPQNVTSTLDISDGFTWTQCRRCDTCFNQSTPLYNPALSSTYSNFSTKNCDSTKVNQSSICEFFGITSADDCNGPCKYQAKYNGVVQNTTGVLATDSFTLGSTSAPNIFFGCSFENYGDDYNSSGFIGLGRGPLSPVLQFPFTRFSYCLSSDQRKHSPVNFSSLAKLQGSGQSTPLLQSDLYPESYYIGLANITVGTTPLNIPSSTFKFSKIGDGGVLLATLLPFTYLEKAAYDLVVQAFNSSMKNQTSADGSNLGLDLCYKNGTKWPSMTLQFDGGATLKLKMVNYVYEDPDTSIQCLAILPSSGVSSLGTFIQMDTNFVIDLENKTISFEKCFDNSGSSVVSNILHLVTTVALFVFCMLKYF